MYAVTHSISFRGASPKSSSLLTIGIHETTETEPDYKGVLGCLSFWPSGHHPSIYLLPTHASVNHPYLPILLPSIHPSTQMQNLLNIVPATHL